MNIDCMFKAISRSEHRGVSEQFLLRFVMLGNTGWLRLDVERRNFMERKLEVVVTLNDQ